MQCMLRCKHATIQACNPWLKPPGMLACQSKRVRLQKAELKHHALVHYAMLCSGHLWPFPGDAAAAPPSSPDCLHCGDCVFREGQAPHPRELPWLHVCHLLLRCSAPSQKPRALALLAFHNDLSETHNCLRCIDADGLNLSADALGTKSSETWDATVSALLPQLAACLDGAHFSPDDELALHRRLLSILLHPAEWASLLPPQGDAFV